MIIQAIIGGAVQGQDPVVGGGRISRFPGKIDGPDVEIPAFRILPRRGVPLQTGAVDQLEDAPGKGVAIGPVVKQGIEDGEFLRLPRRARPTHIKRPKTGDAAAGRTGLIEDERPQPGRPFERTGGRPFGHAPGPIIRFRRARWRGQSDSDRAQASYDAPKDHDCRFMARKTMEVGLAMQLGSLSVVPESAIGVPCA